MNRFFLRLENLKKLNLGPLGALLDSKTAKEFAPKNHLSQF